MGLERAGCDHCVGGGGKWSSYCLKHPGGGEGQLGRLAGALRGAGTRGTLPAGPGRFSIISVKGPTRDCKEKKKYLWKTTLSRVHGGKCSGSHYLRERLRTAWSRRGGMHGTKREGGKIMGGRNPKYWGEEGTWENVLSKRRRIEKTRGTTQST